MSSLQNSTGAIAPQEAGYAPPSARQSLRRRSAAGFGGGRGFWGLSDQGIVSAGNFATNIFLARYLAPRDFGCFALLFDIILILNSFTGAVIWFPLSVRGAAGGRGRIRRYTTASILLTLAALVPLSAAMSVTAGLMSHRITVAAWAAMALVAWQLQETSRRGLTAQFRFFDAIWGDVFSYPGQALMLLLLGMSHRLTLESVFATIAATSLAGFVLQSVQVGLKPMRWNTLRGLMRSYWLAGRWMLLSSVAGILSVQAFTWVLAAFGGLEVLAGYQALVNLLRIGNPIIAAVSGLMLPVTARVRSREGMRAAARAAGRYAAEGAALLMPYYLLMLLWPQQILSLVYGHQSPYVPLVNTLRLYAAANVVFYFAQMILTFMSAVEKTRAVFWAQFWTMAATVVVSLPLTAYFGRHGIVAGVVVGVGISILARFAAALYSLRSVNWSEEATGAPAEGDPFPRLPTLSAA